MVENALQSQAQGDKKQEKAMSQTFVNFSQVKKKLQQHHNLILLVLREFIVTLFGRNYQFFNPKIFRWMWT